MSKLLRSFTIVGDGSCWRPVSTTMKTTLLSLFFVLWGIGSIQAQVLCEPSFGCPADITVECGTDLNNYDVLGTISIFDEGDCEYFVSPSDDVLSSNGCTSVIARTWTITIPGSESSWSCTQIITIVDTTGPVIAALEPISVQCNEEVPAAMDITAIDECGGESYPVDDFLTQDGEIVETCCLTTAMGPGADWSVWLPVLTEGCCITGANWVFDGCGHFDKYADGTARIYGTIYNTNNPSQQFVVNMLLENKRDWASWSALGRNYKNDFNFGCANTNHINWSYYELVGGFSTLTGAGDLAGDVLYLYHMPSSYYFGFQNGIGANNKNCNNGISGWFTYTGFLDGQAVAGHGDLNSDAACEPVNDQECANSSSWTRYYRAVDSCGNVTQVEQEINVLDTTPPTFDNCPESMTIDCSAVVPPVAENVTASDNCTGAVTVVYNGEVAAGTSCFYLIRRTWTATDLCGNEAECIQEITVVDTTAPTLSGLPEQYITVECDAVPAIAEVTVTDNCDTTVTVNYHEEFSPGECENDYYLIRSWTSSDICQNTTTFVQTIHVQDTTAPVFDPYTVYQSVECTEIPEAGLTATDNCGEATVELITDVCTSGGCLGMIYRVYVATDACGNSTTAEQFIAIMDYTAPVLVGLPEETTLECSDVEQGEDGNYFGNDGVYGEDNCGYHYYNDCIIPVTVTYSEEVVATDDNCEASYDIIRTWTAVDYCENDTTVSVVFHIVDTTAPDLYIPYNYTAECDDELYYGEAYAWDNCSEYTISEEVDTVWLNCAHNYDITRTFVATDACGNASAPQTQTISVRDTTAPEFNEYQESYEFECNTPIETVQPTADDNCGLVTYESSDSEWSWDGPCFALFYRTTTATDECGNSSTATQTIIIRDTTAPVITGELIVEIPCEEFSLNSGIFVEATDNCNAFEIFIDSTLMVSGECAGVYIRYYSAYDVCGNHSTTFEQIIRLTDETGPVGIEPLDISVLCSDTIPSFDPMFTDNCGGEVDVVYQGFDVTGDCNVTYTETWTAYDNCGNMTVIDRNVTIYDNVNPWFTEFPVDVTVECDQELPAVVWPIADDNCDDNVDITLAVDTVPGECPNEMFVYRTFRGVDNCNNQVLATQTISVVDTNGPVYAEQNADFSYECDDDIAVIEPVVSDACGGVTQTYTDDWYYQNDCAGLMYRTWVGTDECGNTSSFVQTIHIYDETAPVIAGEYEIFMPCDQITDAIMVTATDNCDDDVYIEIVNEQTFSGSCAGHIERIYRAWDDCQNWSEFTQFIILTDTVAPTVDAEPMDMTYECDDEWSPASPVFSDNCDNELDIFPISSVIFDGCTYTYTYSWTAVDNCDNEITVDQVIVVSDYTAPVASFEPQDVTFECGTMYDILAPYFTDNCDDTLSLDSGVDEVTVDCDRVITYWWSATDDCGHTTMVDWVVTIEDTTPPTLEVPASQVINCYEPLVWGEAFADDICDENVDLEFTDATTPGECPQEYTITRTWVATDECGNSTTLSSSIQVVDNNNPVFTFVPESVTIECDEDLPTDIAQAYDSCSVATVSSSDVYYYESACYTQIIRTFTAIDECGNTSYADQWITIVDTTAPVITGEPITYIPCEEFSMESGVFVTATDNCNLFEIVIDSTQQVSGECAGVYLRYYTAYDICQNVSDQFIQIIHLTDTIAPVGNEPQDITIACDQQIPFFDPMFTDNCGGEVFVTHTLPSVFGYCGVTYTETWTAEDNCGNTTTVDRTITIYDNVPPTIYAEDSETTVDCNVIVDYVFPEASDNCDLDVEVTLDYSSVPGECPGEYTETHVFTATDECGNTSSVTYITHHVDNVAPSVENVPANASFECDDIWFVVYPSVDDVCSEATLITSIDTIAGNCPNNYEIVYSFYATDECGNTSDTYTTVITIYDETNPTFDNEVADEYYECLNWETYTPQAVTASDNCGSASVDVTIEPMEVDECGNGEWVVGYWAEDLCGNTNYQSYVVHVQDVTAPELSSYPENLVLDCQDAVPAAEVLNATDNCDNFVEVSFEETCVGDCPAPGEENSCDLVIPDLGSNPCNYKYQGQAAPWSMALFSLPSEFKYYILDENYAGNSFTHMNDGSIHVTCRVYSFAHPEGGFDIDVTFNNEMDWAAWSTQSFPTSFKADCLGEASNHESWLYYLLAASSGAEVVGYGSFAGSSLNISHAPANKYFGFQYGDGANNLSGGNGLGGWFLYSGTFLYNQQPVVSGGGNVSGAGDFAWELDCCPDYYIVRCWTAMDCSGNETSWCQTITFADLDGTVNGGTVVPTTPEFEKQDGTIAIVSVQPNPAIDKSVISFTSERNGNLSLQVMDMTGRVVGDLFNNKVEAGLIYRADFNTISLESGTYMIRLTNGSEQKIERVQIVR